MNKSFKYLGLPTLSSASDGGYVRCYLVIQAGVLAMGVGALLCGKKMGPYLLMLATVTNLAVIMNPLVDFGSEVDNTMV